MRPSAGPSSPFKLLRDAFGNKNVVFKAFFLFFSFFLPRNDFRGLYLLAFPAFQLAVSAAQVRTRT